MLFTWSVKVWTCVFFTVVFDISCTGVKLHADTSFAINRIKIVMSWTMVPDKQIKTSNFPWTKKWHMSRKWAALSRHVGVWSVQPIINNQSIDQAYVCLWGYRPYTPSLNDTPIRWGLIGWRAHNSQCSPPSRHVPKNILIFSESLV